jgi:hypothetical protein
MTNDSPPKARRERGAGALYLKGQHYMARLYFPSLGQPA